MMKNLRSLSGLALAGLLYFTPNMLHAQWTYLGTAGFSTGTSTYQTMALGSDGSPYVAYNDQSFTPSGKAVAMKYNGSAWVTIGTAGFTTSSAEHGSLAVGPGDTLYFSYQDGPSGQAAVMKFDGTDWVTLGSTGISAGTATYTCMKVNNAGTPYVAYVDASTNRACVKMFDGTNWVNTGATAEVSMGGASYLSMDLDAAGFPWIGFADAVNSNNTTVMRFNGSTWSTVGAAGFSGSLSGVIYMDLTISPANEAYVAYANPFAGVTANVQKFDGTSWSFVGGAGITTGNAIFNTITIDADGIPYIAFMDGSVSGSKGSVMQYDAASTAWNYFGTAGFTGTGAGYLNSVIDGNTYLYVTNTDSDFGGRTSVMRYQICNPSATPVVGFTPSAVFCAGDTITLTVSGALNDDSYFAWYTGSCHGTSVGTGSGVEVVVTDTTVFYCSSEGACVYAADTCVSMTVIPLETPAEPTITLMGATLSSSAATGNQWALSGTDIAGANSQTYVVTAAGWYSVTVTNAGGCSATSDSLFVPFTSGMNENTAFTASVYPVPFSHTLNIQLTSAGNSAITVSDPQGRTVFAQTGLQMSNSFDLSHLVNGVYLVTVQQQNIKTVYRVVKQ